MESVIIEYSPTKGNLKTRRSNPPDSIISNIISTWNKQSLTGFSKKPFKFHIVLHAYKECMKDVNPSYGFSQDKLKHTPNSILQPLPIIHLTDADLFEKDNVCRWKKIIDSSIWNHYIIYEKENFITNLKEAIIQIGKCYDEERYSLSVAQEYCDFYARMVEQSHLYENSAHAQLSPFLFHSEKEMKAKIEDYWKKEHSVSLHTMHKYRWRFLLLDDKSIEPMSEVNEQKCEICKLQIIAQDLALLGFTEDTIWYRTFDFQPIRSLTGGRVLDEENRIIEKDKAGNYIEPIIQCGKVKDGVFQTNVTDKTKFTASEMPAEPKDIQIVIDCVKHVDAAQYCLQKYKYEIVLLDYLLDKDRINKKQEYGYQLLEKLYEWHKIQRKGSMSSLQKDLYIPGPNKRFHFMFTSAFTTAVHERMLEKGFAKSERGLWYIGDGACPTNTPYLFSYQLMLLMRHRVKDLRKENEGNQLTIIDLLEHIYVEKGKAGTEETRQKAHDHFNHVLFMRDKYKRLEKDFSKTDEDYLKDNNDDAKYIMEKMRSSLFVQSAFKVVHHFSGAFFEHLQHLVYLTAFGTIRQWQDMWEEYVFVNKELCDYDKFVDEEAEKDKEGNDEKRGKAISDAIREYIINLKENNY